MIESFVGADGAEYPVTGPDWRSKDGSPFLIEPTIREMASANVDLISLGEAPTPVVSVRLGDAGSHSREYLCKLEYRLPSGSFKDRGAQLLVSALRHAGVDSIVEDSSGNAGAALATYAAAAGMGCTIVIPRSARGPVVRQIEMSGARLVRVPGPRSRATERAQGLARTTCYASHIYNPLFNAGTARLADELVEQGEVPDSIVLPVGNGTLLLGLYHGFARHGRTPRLMAAQVSGLDPLVQSVHAGAAKDERGGMKVAAKRSGVQRAARLAPGIAVSHPPRLGEMADAIRGSGGTAVSVAADSILAMQRALAGRGLYVETTAAVGAAAAVMLDGAGAFAPAEKVMIILTGSGLKR